MIIGFVGSGHIGSTVARLAVERGHQVVLSNSRTPDTLSAVVDSLGPNARAATAAEAAAAGEIVVVSVPFGRYKEVPAQPLAGKIVVDTNNYYPERDGRFPVLDAGESTESELLAEHLPGARVVRAFNNIYYQDLAEQGAPAGTPNRRALPIAGDDPEAKRVVGELIDSCGFDVVDVGSLAASRQFRRDTPAYVHSLDTAGLREALAKV
jgi:hypothetical protein